MTRVRSRPSSVAIPARVMTSPVEMAAIFGRGEEWFRRRRKHLEAAGFPPRDDLLAGWDARAIDRWFDQRAGIDSPPIHDGATLTAFDPSDDHHGEADD